MEQVNSLENIISINKDGKYVFDLTKYNQSATFEVLKNIKVDLLLIGFNKNTSLSFNISDNSFCQVKFLIENEEKTINLQGNLNENSTFNLYFADYCKENTTVKSNINLLKNNSNTNVYFTSLAKGTNLKNYDISFNHEVGYTTSNFEGYGVAMDDSFIKINGVSHIKENAIKSEAHQKVKCLLFDEKSRAIANPILKIDCDDIIASHACAIGSLNNDHIFYLLSRGLSLEEAHRLIIMGYLLPIKDYFDEEDKNKIVNYVEGDF